MPKRASRKATGIPAAGGLSDLSIRHPNFQKLLLALHSAMEAKAFLKAAEHLIHAAIPCDVVYTLLHYSIDREKSSVADGSDGTVSSNEPVRGSLLGNPIAWVLSTKHGVRAHSLRAYYGSAAEMEDDPFLRRYIQSIDVHHAVVIPMWREAMDSADLVIGPHRAVNCGEFTRDEMDIMETLQPHIDAAYRRVNRLQTECGALLGLEQCMTPLPTMLLDWELTPSFFNPSGQEALAHWSGTNRHLKLITGNFKIPPDLLGELRAMRAQWRISLRNGDGTATLPEHIFEHPTELGCRARISMNTLRSPHFGNPSFLIRFEHDHPGRNAKIAAISRLSPAERNLVDHVLNGESNQEIADAVGRSVNTIKSALHQVFIKLRVDSRARLITRFR